MIEKDLSWISNDGISFFGHLWAPEEDAKAAITLVHGFSDHCMRYVPYFNYLVNAGIAVVGFDLRGHGKTGGKRGRIKSYTGLLNDIETALEKSREQFPNVPQFIYGHSMGGNLALNYLERRNPDLKGGIISAPWLTLTNNPNRFLQNIVHLLDYLVPNITVDGGIDIHDISRDVVEVEKYSSDTFNHGRISFRLLSQIFKTGLWAIANADKLRLPVLLMHGTDDHITSPISSKQTALNNPEKIEYKEWPGYYHELHNEPTRSEVAQNVIDWINKQI